METSNGANEICQPVQPAAGPSPATCGNHGHHLAQRPAAHRIAVATGRVQRTVRTQLFSVMNPPSIG
jgi:hypothetical protein